MNIYKIRKRHLSDIWEEDTRISINDDHEYEAFLQIIEESHTKTRVTVEIDDNIIETVGFIDESEDGDSYVIVEENSAMDAYTKQILHSLNFSGFINELMPKIEYSEYIQSLQKTSVCNSFIDREVISEQDGSKYYYSKLYNKNSILWGEPGAGKTTTVKRITYELINKYESQQTWKMIPVYFQLRHMKPEDDWTGAIQEYINGLFSENVTEQFNHLSSKGKVVYIFDGLDELTYDIRDTFVNWINIFKRKFVRAKIIITSRPSESVYLFDKFDKFHLDPFSINQIKELTYRKLYDNKWRDFLSCIQIDDELIEIVRNPLLLNASYILYLTNKLSPSSKSSYLRNFMHVLISEWDIHRDIYRYSEKLPPDRVTYYLSRLAYNAKVEDVNVFSYINAEKWLNIDRGEAEELLNKIREICGLIIDCGDSWQFSHKAFQDFLCANYLVEKSDGVGHAKQTFNQNSNWHGVWNNAYGLSNDPEYYFEEYLGKRVIDVKTVINICKIVQESVKLDRKAIMQIVKLIDGLFNEMSKKVDLASQKRVTGSIVVSHISISIRETYDLEMSLIESFFVAFIETRWSGYFEKIRQSLIDRNDQIRILEEIYIREGSLKRSVKGNRLEIYLEQESGEIA